MKELADEEDKSEALQQFIKERKKQLIEQAFAHIGNSKWLTKINKEAYYYAETLKNYKELFADSKKAEATVKTILNKIPAFQQFMQKNSQLAALFGPPGGAGSSASAASLAGLQTRAGVQSLIQDRIAAGGPNAMQQVQQNIQAAQGELTKLKDKILKAGGGSSDMEMPDGFSVNPEKTKTFIQRIQLNWDFQTTRHNNLFPVNSDVGISATYKLSGNSMISIGSSFKTGWGTGFNHIRLSSQGVSIRGGLDWRLKGNLFIAGNYEQNYFSAIRNINQLRNYRSWKTSALLGLSKKYKAGKKRSGEVKLLYDFFYNRPPIRTQPLTIRFGYNLK